MKRFSVLTTLFLACSIAAGGSLWRMWEPWVQIPFTVPSNGNIAVNFIESKAGVWISGLDNGVIVKWDFSSGIPIYYKKCSDHSISKIAVDVGRGLIAAVDEEDALFIIDSSGQLVASDTNNFNNVNCLSFVGSSGRLAIGEAGGKLLFWSPSKGIHQNPVLFGAAINGLAASNDREFVYLCIDSMEGENILKYRSEDFSLAQSFESCVGCPSDPILAPSGSAIFVRDRDSKDGVICSTTLTGREPRIFLFGCCYKLDLSSFCDRTQRVLLPDKENLNVVAFVSGIPIQRYAFGETRRNGCIPSARFSPDCSRIIATRSDGEIRIWDSGDSSILFRMEAFESGYNDFWFANFLGNNSRIIIFGTGISPEMLLRRRPEQWWGVAWLLEFWLTVVFGIALIWSLRRDWKTLRGKKVGVKAEGTGTSSGQ